MPRVPSGECRSRTVPSSAAAISGRVEKSRADALAAPSRPALAPCASTTTTRPPVSLLVAAGEPESAPAGRTLAVERVLGERGERDRVPLDVRRSGRGARCARRRSRAGSRARRARHGERQVAERAGAGSSARRDEPAARRRARSRSRPGRRASCAARRRARRSSSSGRTSRCPRPRAGSAGARRPPRAPRRAARAGRTPSVVSASDSPASVTRRPRTIDLQLAHAGSASGRSAGLDAARHRPDAGDAARGSRTA